MATAATRANSEAMYVQLSNPVGATIGYYQYGSYGYAFGTIYDDDITPVPPPELRIGPASVVEGGDGDTGALHFPVSLDRPATSTVTVDVQSFDYAATVADGDYDAIPLTTLTFSAGQQVKDVVVTTHGDTLDEGEFGAHVPAALEPGRRDHRLLRRLRLWLRHDLRRRHHPGPAAERSGSVAASVVEGGDGDTGRSTSPSRSIGRPPRPSPSTSSRSTTAQAPRWRLRRHPADDSHLQCRPAGQGRRRHDPRRYPR